MNTPTVMLPEWLLARASVERALHGRVSRRTAHMINTRMRTERNRHAPPLGQNFGTLLNEQLHLRAVRLRERLHNASTRIARYNARRAIENFRDNAERLGIAE